MGNFTDLELQLELDKLREKFINKWIPADPTEHTPDKFQYDVKSFCILAHAAFEEYIEKISVSLSARTQQEWHKKKLSKSAICLLMTYDKSNINIELDETKEQVKVFDQIRNGLSNAVIEHSKVIYNNHGFSKKYLRTILTPVGIDIPSETKLMNSLQELAKARGSFAHTMSADAVVAKAKNPMVPEDAANIVKDCYDLCMLISRLAQLELNENLDNLKKISIRDKLTAIKKETRKIKFRS